MFGAQRLDVYAFNATKLASVLKLPRTNQLSYIASYVWALGCRSVLIERHYIDRDYIEDYGLFYSRSLYPYKNYCQRVHFFRTTRASTVRRFTEVVHAAAEGREAFREACDQFSHKAYLGFCVVKPLSGSPVGRTVLATFEQKTPDNRKRVYCTRQYTAHVNGIELSVDGLPFQEQDVGVSACATTAIWSSLQKAQDSESLPPATPAQITTLASRFALPFGRALPADEGLSVDQMCQAVQAFGVSPSLYCASDYSTTRSYLYSALRSDMSPIIIMQHQRDTNSYHAVTGVGMRLTSGANRSSTNGIADAAEDLEAVYVHDDRTGPYLRANLIQRPEGDLKLDLLTRRRPDRVDPWLVTHVLIPTHPKIRLSLSSLRKLAADLVGHLHQACDVLFTSNDRAANPISFEVWITRGPAYLSQLYFEDGVARGNTVRDLASRTIFPRYVGVVRFTSRVGVVDVLYDTTSTIRNLHAIAVVVPQPSRRKILAASLIAQIVEARLVY